MAVVIRGSPKDARLLEDTIRELLARLQLMTASGESSISNYECGTPETISLWEALRRAPGVWGTRFSGAGFGGSCVALVDTSAVPGIIDEVSREYSAEHPGPAASAGFHLCSTSGPARLIRRLT